MKRLIVRIPAGFLAVLLVLGPLPRAAEVPDGLGQGKKFDPQRQPATLDALFNWREEEQNGPTVIPTVRGDAASDRGDCPTWQARDLGKRVAITGFPIVDERQAGLGGLNDVPQRLPDLLLNRFESKDRVVPHSAVTRRLYDEAMLAPTRQQRDRHLSRASRLSRSMGMQFVVSGVVRDMGVVDSSAWDTSFVSKWSRAVGWADQSRRLVVDLYMYDGFSGALVMEQRFTTEGEWPFQPSHSVGFGSGEFADTHYGKQTSELVDRMAKSISETLKCQPFMAPIERVDKRSIRIASGTESGLEPGDEAALYRSERFLDQPSETPLLQPTNQTMRVERVQSRFSSGRLALEGNRINVQRGDMVVIW